MERRRTETDATDGCITGYSGTRPGDRMRAANATPDLTPAERGVFVALAYHRLDLFTPSDEQLLEECGAILHRSTLVAARKRLRARGLLDWTRPCKKLMYSRLNLSLGGGPDLSATTDMSAASAQPVGGGRHEPEPGSEDDFADLARMRHRFRISMHLCCEPHRFRRSGRRYRAWIGGIGRRCVDVRGGGWHYQTVICMENWDTARAAAPASRRSPVLTGAGALQAIRMDSTAALSVSLPAPRVKVLAYGYACENDSHIRRAVILTRAPIFNSFSRSVAH